MGGSRSASREPPLVLRLLGDVVIEYDGARVVALDAPRLQSLLALLLLHRGVPLQRPRLAYGLWPDSSDRQALTNLRHLLHDLRRALPAPERYLQTTSRTVAWRGDAAVDADVVTFRQAAERAAAAADGRQAIADLREASAVYRGDLLPGCWDDVILTEREGLRRQAIAVLDRLSRLSEQAGDLDGALAAAQRRLDVDPLDEPSARRLMRLHLRCGSRARALRVYHQCAGSLARELGVEPEDETAALRAALLGSGGSASVEVADADGGGTIGRERELSSVLAAWRRARTGEAHMLLLAGEPGIGKTHLLEALAERAARGGAAVLRSRCFEAADQLAWGPVAEWLRSAEMRPALQRLDEVWVAELSRLTPELRRTTSGRALAARHGEEGRRILFEAVARSLRELRRPALLIVDDLHWCDNETLGFLDYLLCHERDAPFLVASSVRSGEADGRATLARLTTGLARNGRLSEVPVGPLDEAGTAALAYRLLGRRLEPPEATRLHADTEGNPLFVIEAVRSGLGRDGGASGLTPTIRAVILSRLAALSSAARELVEVAAVVGRSFSPDVLPRASGLGEEDVAEVLDELWRRRIVREHGAGYDFTHDKIREVAYAAISPPRRRRLHRKVARALQSLHGDGPGSVSAALARHFEQGGLIEEAIAALRHAAGHAVSVFATNDAIEKLHRALRLLGRLPSTRRREELELDIRVELGPSVVARYGYGAPETNQLYLRARSLSRRLGLATGAPVLRGLALGAVADCRFETARELGEELLSHADNEDAAVEGHYVLGIVSFWVGELEEAERHLRLALERNRPEHVTRHLTRFAQDPRAVCLSRLGHTLWHRGQPDTAMQLVSEAVTIAEELDHPTSHGYALVYAAWVAGEMGDVAAMRQWVGAGVQRWTRQRLGFFRPATPLFEGWLRLLQGDAGGVGQLREGVEGWRREGRNLHLTHALSLLASAQLDGCGGDGLETVEEALRWTAGRRQRYLEPELLRLRGEHLLAAGRRADGLADVRRAAAGAAAIGARSHELRAALSLARHTGDTRRLGSVLRSFPERRGSADVRAAAALVAGGVTR